MNLSIILPFLFLFSAVFASHDNPPSNALKIVEYKLDQTTYYPFGMADIVLENGSHWKFDFHVNDKGNLEEWNVGDFVHIYKYKCEHYSLKNLNLQGMGYHGFNLDLSTKDNFPKLEDIEEDGYLLVLSDGSQWSVGYWNARHLDMWNIGDRVIVTPSETILGTTHALYNINSDRYYYINATQVNSIDIASDF